MTRIPPPRRTLGYKVGGLSAVLTVLSLVGYAWTRIPYPFILFFTVIAAGVGTGYLVVRHPLDTTFRAASIRRTATRVPQREQQEPGGQRQFAEFKQYRWRSGGQ